MKSPNDIFDKQLQDALSGFEGGVSFDDWDAIAGKLDAIERKRFVWGWWLLAGMVVIGLITGILYNILEPTTTEAPKVVQLEEAPATLSDQKANELETGVQADFGKAAKDAQNVELSKAKSTYSGNTYDVTQNRTPKTSKRVERGTQKDPSLKSFEFDRIAMEGKELKTLTDMSMHFNTAIFSASEIDANEFYKIPTSNNGTQKAPSNPLNKGSWELGLSASPALASKLVKVNGSLSGLLNKHYNDVASYGESVGTSYQLGFNANRYITRNLYLSTGLQYDQIGEAVHYDYTTVDVPLVDMDNKRIEYLELPPMQQERVQYNGHNSYQFFEIPLKFGIVVPILQDRMRVKTEIGLQYMILVTTKGVKVDASYLELYDLQVNRGFQRHSLGSSFNTGLYWNFKSNVELGVTPYFQMNLTAIQKNTEVLQSRPYNYGFNIRFNYNLSGLTK